jgi:hypothetical protein
MPPGLRLRKRCLIGWPPSTRYHISIQEKPPTPLLAERASNDAGVVFSQDAKNRTCGPSILSERHGEDKAHGTAQERRNTDGCPLSDMPPPLRFSLSRRQSASAPKSDYGSVSEAAGRVTPAQCHLRR